MRCQRCGFEIEPGQTFCSMCGTEQSKALRKEKRKIESIFWIIKVVSKNHLKMYINLFLNILVLLHIIFACKGEASQMAYICANALIMIYLLFQCLIPYKNPNSSKSKAYKLGIRASLAGVILLMIMVLFTDSFSLINLIKNI